MNLGPDHVGKEEEKEKGIFKLKVNFDYDLKSGHTPQVDIVRAPPDNKLEVDPSKPFLEVRVDDQRVYQLQLFAEVDAPASWFKIGKNGKQLHIEISKRKLPNWELQPSWLGTGICSAGRIYELEGVGREHLQKKK